MTQTTEQARQHILYSFEAYIPCSRQELVEWCLAEGRLSEAEARQFQVFCDLLAAYYHFHFHGLLETLKASFAPFNPDRPDARGARLTQDALDHHEEQFVKTLTQVLTRANYRQLDERAVRAALGKSSLIDLQTEVDFADIDRLLFFARGKMTMPITLRKLWRPRVTLLPVYEHVVLGLKFKDAGYFLHQRRNPQALQFTPGRLYFYFYRNIPEYDLELLFPHVHLKMTLWQRMLFVIPALGAGVSVLLKALPNLLLIAGVILFFTLGPSFAARTGVSREQVTNIMPTLTALLSLSVALGWFAFKQYNGYQNRRLQFMKHVTETLFFKNMASNASVLHVLVDAAEEEETKEVILLYYHLLVAGVPLTLEELNGRVERWLMRTFQVGLDFDIEHTLQEIAATIPPRQNGAQPSSSPLPALVREEAGHYTALSLAEAKAALDRAWDGAFPYHAPAVA